MLSLVSWLCKAGPCWGDSVFAACLMRLWCVCVCHSSMLAILLRVTIPLATIIMMRIKCKTKMIMTNVMAPLFSVAPVTIVVVVLTRAALAVVLVWPLEETVM